MKFLNRNDLWRFALDVYPHAKSDLLSWQDTYGIHINDLLLLAFAHHRRIGVDLSTWVRIECARPRSLLRRVRRIRYRLDREDPARPLALEWELLLERIDLTLLSECLDATGVASERAAAHMARHWNLAGAWVEAWMETVSDMARD